MWQAFQDIRNRHERLKKYIHEAFRYPLPRSGRIAMGFVYFLVPVVGGWHVMQWAISKAHNSIGEKGENLEVKEIEGIGSLRVGENGERTPVGAGGWGGGVHLAESDSETQERNKQLLAKFLRQQKRKNNAEES